MKILAIGAKGFLTKNLCWALKSIRNKENRTRPNLKIEEIYEYEIDSAITDLDFYKFGQRGVG